MKKQFSVKSLTVCAMCIALCCVLPMAFHSMGLGRTFSPLHFPVILCGLVCGPVFGAVCGVLGPILSCLATGMPNAAGLVSMVPELFAYGLVCGLGMLFIRVKHLLADVYLSMIPALITGRLVGGAVSALVYTGAAGGYSFAMFISSYLVGTFPGMIAQLALIPLLVLTLEKTKVIPARYTKIS